MNLGIYLIISNAPDYKKIKDSDKNKAITDIIKDLNLSVIKAEKDISIYKSSITKMKQAKELIQESIIQNKKKNYHHF